MIDPNDLADAASARLGVPAAALLKPATAALEAIANNISTTVDTLDPDSALLFIGATLLTERIYQDVPTTTGEIDTTGTITASGLVISEDLLSDLRYYWLPQQAAWGVG